VTKNTYHLGEKKGVLTLFKDGVKDGGLSIDFHAEFDKYKKQKLSAKKDLLARALGLSVGAKICDLTMGLAQDSFKLVCMGARVTAVERNPTVVALVKDGMERAKDIPLLKYLNIHVGDMKEFVETNKEKFDAYYMDPMFAHKRTALPKKDMQYLADIVESSREAEYGDVLRDLIERKKKVVVKRPRTGAPLCEMAPKHMIEGKMVRFDVY